MPAVKPCALPADALLEKYAGDLHYTDCYCIELSQRVSQAQYVNAFYTTWVFKLERLILRWLAARPSSDAQLAQLAAGEIEHFSAWQVEGRSANQLLLSDFRGRTRSWLMAMPAPGAGAGRSRLYFGSAVVAIEDPVTHKASLGLPFRALLGFHKIYSRILLGAAGARLRRLVSG